ncbi:MAG: hypothetical protein LBD24_06490 [Spirochaetaceae bacterium]|jgi:hypothetical protein|nr:hypothetical protein [Spirochaetaceae bacterium]
MYGTRFAGILVIMAAALWFMGCPSDDGGSNNEDSYWGGPTSGNPVSGDTFVKFENRSVFSVSIYTDAGRTDKLTDVAALNSRRIENAPNSNGAAFYLTYHVTVEGVTFPYYDNTSVVAARIDEHRTTTVSIPALVQGEVSRVYVKIKNNGGAPLTFKHGNSVLMPADAVSSLVISGETGVYALSPGPAAGYAFMKNGIQELAFPDGFSEFQASHIYSFSFNGSAITMVQDTAIDFVLCGFDLGWDGLWNKIGQNAYTSNLIEHRSSTQQILMINARVSRRITVELTASTEAGNDCGYASELDGMAFSWSSYTIMVSGAGRQTYTYTVPTGTHTIKFRYQKNATVSHGTDSVTVKILSVDLIED